MENKDNFDLQFEVGKEHFLKKLDFLDWYRYFFIIKEIIDIMPASVLEIGSGSGIVRNCLKPIIGNYKVMDVNRNLNPDIESDLRIQKNEIKNNFGCIICADVLEHMPFTDTGRNLENIHSYLKENGIAVITIPHRRSNFLFMTPENKPRVFTVPTGFLSPGSFYRRFIKRKIWIDPDHCWEIGDGKVRIRDVGGLFKESGFKILKFKKLLYVDFWVLEKIK